MKTEDTCTVPVTATYRIVGVSHATMSAVKGGKTVAPATAQKIAAALGMTVEQIVETKEA